MGDFPIIPAVGTVFVVCGAMVVAYYWLGRRARAFKAEVVGRQPVPDAELADRYFAGGVSPDVPARVRRLFADHTGYPRERLLPDDDLSFFWEDTDPSPLVHALEEEFGVALPDDRLAAIRPTIRDVVTLIEECRSPNRLPAP